MTLWAIVPVKPLNRGKSRLAGVLSKDERTDLNRRLLAHTLQILTSIPEIERVLVISRDPSALALSRDFQARTVQEDGATDLNTALERATIVVKKSHVQSVLIVPSDLPLLTIDDVGTVVRQGLEPPVVVAAPDRHLAGTNLLLINPLGAIHYQFGPNSFQCHCESAQQAGARLAIVNRTSIAIDLDTPEDLALINAEQKSSQLILAGQELLTEILKTSS